jgi:hypothetical protein
MRLNGIHDHRRDGDPGVDEARDPVRAHTTTSISVTAPSNGTTAVLVLQSSKDGQIIFRDDAQTLQLQ